MATDDQTLQATPDTCRVGVIGMGIMGSPMACCLLRAEYPVTVYNRSSAKCEAARALDGKSAESVSQLASDTDVILVMLSERP